MRRLLWVAGMPLLVLALPWVGALLSHGKISAWIVAAIWAAMIFIGIFLAMGPALIGLILLAVFQLARMPWLPPRSKN